LKFRLKNAQSTIGTYTWGLGVGNKDVWNLIAAILTALSSLAIAIAFFLLGTTLLDLITAIVGVAGTAAGLAWTISAILALKS
jgi:hypothetical protein